MAQISKGDTFVDGQQVTGARLNQLVDSSVLLVGAITNQPSITANTLEATDSTIVNDAGTLKEATIGDILNSGLDTTFDICTNDTTVSSALNGKINKDINMTPNDGVAVTGKAFASVDGITAVVTSTAHELEDNMLLDVTASDAVYTGQHFITVLTVDTFSFVISQTTPVAASGTLSYTKKGSVKVIGSESISGRLTVNGATTINGDANLNGNANLNGDANLNGNTNITGSFKLNDEVGYALIDVIEETVPNATGTTANTLHTLFTSASYTKPAGELWIVELSSNLLIYNDGSAHWRITDSTDTITYTASYWNNPGNGQRPLLEKFYLNSANEHTGTFVLRAKAPVPNIILNGTAAQLSVFSDASKRIDGKFRIFKYKTA